MPAWLGAVLVLAYLAAPTVELRLWRAGRLSDRTVAILLLTRLPVLLGVMWLASGIHFETLLIVAPAVLITSKVGYGWLLSSLRDKREELRSERG